MAQSAEATIPVPQNLFFRLVDNALNDQAPIALGNLNVPEQLRYWPPAIGEAWPAQGGVYAGIARGYDGAADAYIIVGPQAEKALKWDAAVEWAKNQGAPQHADFRLPSRKEQALMFANVPELFEKDYYWSGEQCAGSEGCAWCQDFSYGDQGNGHKDDAFRARAVRRLSI